MNKAVLIGGAAAFAVGIACGWLVGATVRRGGSRGGEILGAKSAPETAAPSPAAMPEGEGKADEDARAQPSSLHLSPSSHDFGRLVEGEAREAALSIEREGGASVGGVRLGRLLSSCPCIEVRAPKAEFSPGERASVSVRIHTLTLSGRQSFPVYVETLAPERTTLRADISVETVRAPAKLIVRPEAVNLGLVQGDCGKTASVEIVNLTRSPVRLGAATCTAAGLAVKVSRALVEPGAAAVLSVTTPEGDAALPPGPISGLVRLETSLAEHAIVAIPVAGTAR